MTQHYDCATNPHPNPTDFEHDADIGWLRHIANIHHTLQCFEQQEEHPQDHNSQSFTYVWGRAWPDMPPGRKWASETNQEHACIFINEITLVCMYCLPALIHAYQRLQPFSKKVSTFMPRLPCARIVTHDGRQPSVAYQAGHAAPVQATT